MKIIVSGGLVMNGTNGSMIVLTNVNSAPWNGIVIQHFNISSKIS